MRVMKPFYITKGYNIRYTFELTFDTHAWGLGIILSKPYGSWNINLDITVGPFNLLGY